MIQPKARKIWMSFNFSLDPLTRIRTQKSQQRKLQVFNITYIKSYLCRCLLLLTKILFGNFGKWQALLCVMKVTGLFLDFVKLGFVGSVSFIC